MRIAALCLMGWAFVASAAAQSSLPATARADEPTSLPRYMTPAEARLPLPVPQRTNPPSGNVYCPPEYAPCEGLFIAWNAYTTILTQLAVGITVNDPNATVWVVVDSTSEQASASSTLSAAGAHMNQIVFIVAPTDSVWIRDYGPRFIFEDGVRTIIDHVYNRPRPNDDAFNDFLAGYWGIPQYDIGLTHGGGNFHLFENGDAFMTSLILTENPSLTADQVKQRYHDYQNVNLTIYPGFPTSFDSTQHIDMWMFPLGDHQVIIGQYPSSSGQPYTITENATADLVSRGYTVYRTPGWQSGGTHYTYTNAVILNNQCFISKFNVTQDAQALAVFQQGLPGYAIHQIDNSGIIGAAGAMHCIVMHVPLATPEPAPVVSVQAPNGGESWTIGQIGTVLWSAHDDVAVTGVDILLSTDGGTTFPRTLATGIANTGTFNWTIAGPASAHVRIKVIAYDADGNSGEDVSNADFAIIPNGPQVVYNVPLDSDPGWTTTGQWAFGHPTGHGGAAHGYPDPNNGATGTNVYGVNLAGDYATTAGGPYYVKTSAFDLTGYTAVRLQFRRWLNSDYQPYAYATVDVSNNNTSWTNTWNNGTTVSTANAWSTCTYDISTVANDQPTVYVRWGYQIGNGAWAYSGWNIDDIQLIGVRTLVPGDVNCDGVVSFGDINPFVQLLSDPANWQAAYPRCPLLNGDINGDGLVNFGDINPFVALLSGSL
jgi:agmatine deiminase